MYDDRKYEDDDGEEGNHFTFYIHYDTIRLTLHLWPKHAQSQERRPSWGVDTPIELAQPNLTLVAQYVNTRTSKKSVSMSPNSRKP